MGTGESQNLERVRLDDSVRYIRRQFPVVSVGEPDEEHRTNVPWGYTNERRKTLLLACKLDVLR